MLGRKQPDSRRTIFLLGGGDIIIMRKLVLAVAVVAAGAVTFVAAPQAQAQQYPSVAGLTPFSPEANFMSLPGYLRYRYFVTSRTWISYEEAARIVAGG